MRRLTLVTLLAALVMSADSAGALTIGTFRWQLQPYCNVVTLNVTAQGGIFTLDGFDDQCGAGQRASIVGTASQNPDGTIGIGLNTVLTPGAAFVHVDGRIGLASLGGPWRDSAGNSGTLAFTAGAGTGGPLRPVPSNGVAPGSITAAQLAPGAVGGPQIEPTQVQTRVVGTCPDEQYPRGINQNGGLICESFPAADIIRASAAGTDGIFPAAASTVIVSLAANGTGPLVVPFPARLIMLGAARIDRTDGMTAVAECVIKLASEPYVNGAAQTSTATEPKTSLGLTRTLDVAPGTYDVQLQCRSSGNQWSGPRLMVIAVPR